MSIPTVEEQQEAIAAVLRAVSGVERVFVDYPKAIQRRDLPCVTLTPQAATYDRETYGANSLMITRTWRLQVYAMSVEHGREGVAEQTLKPLLTSIPLALAEYPILTLSDDRAITLRLHDGGDTGAIMLMYGADAYIGAEFTFTTEVTGVIEPKR